MLITGLKAYERLTKTQLDELREQAQQDRVRVADLVVHEYDWLMTDFAEHVWTIHVSKHRFTIDFDSPLPNGGLISDNPLLIEDLKLYFVAAKTKQLSNCIILNSKSSCLCFVRNLKRYVIQSMALQAVTNPQMLTKNEFDSVINSMAKTLQNSLGYNQLLVDYFDRTPLELIPIKRYKRNKNSPHVDAIAICEELNVPHYYVLACEQCKQTIARAAISVAAYHSNETLEIRYLKSLEQETFRTMMHSAEYSRSLQVLEGVHALYPVYRDLFNYELVKYPFNRAELLAKQDFSEELQLDGRTRDIPPLLFLKIMDGAARFILDYADDLFEAEDLFSDRFDAELKRTGSSYQAGKAVNAVIKTYKSDDKRRFTPFPLAAYKHAQDCGDSKYGSILEDFIKDDEAGVLTKTQLCAQYGIPYGTLQHIRKMAYASTNSASTTGLSLNKALYQFLPFCCTVLIFALTARREMEVFGLQAGCTYSDDHGNLWIDSYVAKTADASGRGKGNIEDQIRSINELIKGLEILTVQNLPVPPSPPGAPSYRNLKSELVELNNELTRCLKLFSDSVSNGEKLIRDAKNDLKTQTFNYLVSFLMSFSSRTATRDRLHIFTTNYDRIIETGAEIAGLRLIDRFVGTIAPI